MKDIEVKRLLYQDSEAFKAGIEVGRKEVLELVKEMRKAQKKEQQLHMKLVPTIDGEDSFDFVERLLKLESEVDELIREMEG